MYAIQGSCWDSYSCNSKTGQYYKGLNSENEHVAPPTTAHAALRGRAPPPARAQRYEREDRSRDERDRCGRLGVRAARSGARRGARGEHEIACELDGVGGVA